MKIIQTKSFEVAVNEYGDSSASKVCIMLPGRLDTKDYINFVSHGNVLADMEYYAISIDPPGSWDSPGSIENYSTTNYIKVVEELIETLGNRPTILLGHSRGGATAMLASKNSHVFAIILINAAFSTPTEPDKNTVTNGFHLSSRDLPPGSVHTRKQKVFKLPLSYFEDGKKHDQISALLNFAGPKLIIHASNDEFVSMDDAKKIYDQAKDPKMFVEINCTHDYRLYPDAIETANNVIRDFLN